MELQRYNDDGSPNGSTVITSIDRGQSTSGTPQLVVLADGNLALTFSTDAEIGQIYALSADEVPAIKSTAFTKVAPDAATDTALIAVAPGHVVAGDGTIDVVTVGAGSFSVLRNDGAGTLTRIGNAIAAPSVVDMKVADINNDGRPDIVVARAQDLQVFVGKGDGTFEAPTPTTKVKPGNGTITVADLNSDGNQDIATADGSSTYPTPTISILWGDGAGHFAEANYTAAVPTGYNSLAINKFAIGDLNGDGRADVLGITDVNVIPFIASANGSTFSAATAITIGGLNAAVLVDVNGDGKLDIVAANNNGAQILLGRGNGAFSDP